MSVLEQLNALLEVHSELLHLSKQKESIIIKNDIDELNKIIRIEASHVSKSRMLEKSVMQLLATQSLSSYIEQANELKDDLTHTQKQLLDTVNSLKEQNELNQRLLSDSLTFVQGSIHLLRPENKTYTKEASAKSKPRTLFDSKA
ncbi:flagellar biosynthesis/type III secretory pathway chaperone [Alkalihalobacillus xiaoxiensis]|uniref:Flagellar biosynthesis/type III secretory pathway chaperone n=1 Tax=Shouchella xiaoxiensis TaxID=766895 RepID=A0ABS2SZ06_9BACI|nr:flagellar protein FlgN [Shouchella xiaoxiensis]MBM7840436.1 flagellar biosynthesis/type III secretory pathway chaperone [Shouchella xiaoxiensis]